MNSAIDKTLSDKHKFLIITVGGKADPIIKSINEWRPKKVLFICSEESQKKFQEDLKQKLNFCTALKQGRQSNLLSESEKPSSAKEFLSEDIATAKSSGSKNRKNRRKFKQNQHDFKETVKEIFYFLEIDNIETLTLNDPEDMKQALKEIREGTEPKHKKWIENGENYISIVDITGGTKCMSASLTLSAHKWERCVFSYIGGERDKGNTGNVKPGSEKIIKRYNPYDLLGYQSLEEAVLLFKNYNYSAAVDILERAFDNMKQSREGESVKPHLKEEFCSALKWMKAHRDWDDFRHKDSYSALKALNNKHLNNLKEAFRKYDEIDDIERNLEKSIEYLEKVLSSEEIRETNPPSGELEKKEEKSSSLSASKNIQSSLKESERGKGPSYSKQKPEDTDFIKNSAHLIFDLIVNAKRKAAQGRFDDATARLYRAVEAIAQYRLQKKYKTESGKVPYGNLTPLLKEKHKKFRTPDLQSDSESSVENQEKPKPVKLSLQDCWLFLMEKKDPLGNKFKDVGLMGEGVSNFPIQTVRETGKFSNKTDISLADFMENPEKKSPLSQPSAQTVQKKSKREETEKQSPCNPLSKRNKSILAHGFHPLSEVEYESLLEPTVKLFEFLEKDLYKKNIFEFNKGKDGKPYFPYLKNQD